MIKKFKLYKMNESKYTDETEKLINVILDKISNFGYDALSELEKEILQKASKDGIQSLTDYIESDNADLSFDKYGHILINGIPYTEWSMKKDKDISKKDDHKWKDTSKRVDKSGPKMPVYRVRVYKNDRSNFLHYFIYWVEGEEIGNVKKYSTEKGTDLPFGAITVSKKWQSKTIDNLHQEYFDKEYDRYKELNIEELNLFETFINLVRQYKTGKLNTPENEKYLKGLENLYFKFSSL